MPLGTKTGFGTLTVNNLLNASQRKYVANFIGSMKSHRKKMIDNVKKTNMSAFITTADKWGSEKLLNVIDYRNILLESAFTLTPWGVNPESFRIYEAMEAGSIPVFIRFPKEKSPMTPMGIHNPIPQFDNWDEAIDFVDKIRHDFEKLDVLQQNIIAFYQEYKKSMQLIIKSVIDESFRRAHGCDC